MLGHSAEPPILRFRAAATLGFPAHEIASVQWEAGLEEGRRLTLTVPFLGLYGPASPLASFYTERLLGSDQAGRNLQDFLDIYYAGASVLLTKADFHDLAMAYFERAAADNVRHAEIFFDPQTHTDRGGSFDTVMEGLASAMAEAKARFGLTSKLILCFLRHLSEEAAFATLAEAEPWLGQIAGVGLDSSEQGHPPSKFARVFDAAAAKGGKELGAVSPSRKSKKAK
jgi:adenosine deaminase